MGAIAAATVIGGSCALMTTPLLQFTHPETREKVMNELLRITIVTGIVGGSLGGLAAKTASYVYQKITGNR